MSNPPNKDITRSKSSIKNALQTHHKEIATGIISKLDQISLDGCLVEQPIN